MSQNRLSASFLGMLILIPGCLIVVSIFLWWTSYDNFIDLVLSSLDKTEYKSLISEQFFPLKKYHNIRIIVPVLAVVIGASMYYWREVLNRQCKDLSTDLKRTTLLFFNVFHARSKYDRAFLVILVLLGIRSLGYILSTDLIYDECWTFINFTRNGPILSAFTYPSTNNHILLSFLSSLFYFLKIGPGLALRLPVLLFGLGSTMICYKLLRRHFSLPSSLIGVTIYSFSFPVSLYMQLGRGYILICFFYLILLYLTLNRRNINLIWILAASLGFYSIPVFIYPFFLVMLLALFQCLRGDRSFKRTLISLGLVAICVCILYAPIILSTGLKVAFQRNLELFAFGGSQDASWLVNMKDIYAFIVGWEHGWFIIGIITILGLILSRVRQADSILIYAALGMTLPIVVTVIQQMYLPERIFTFLAIHLAILVSYLLDQIPGIRQLHPGRSLVLSLLICLFLSLNFQFHPALQQLRTGTSELHHASSQLIQKGHKSIYLDCEYIKPILEYEAISKSHSIDILMAQPTSIDFHAFDISERYDAVILDQNSPLVEVLDSSDRYGRHEYGGFSVYEIE